MPAYKRVCQHTKLFHVLFNLIVFGSPTSLQSAYCKGLTFSRCRPFRVRFFSKFNKFDANLLKYLRLYGLAWSKFHILNRNVTRAMTILNFDNFQQAGLLPDATLPPSMLAQLAQPSGRRMLGLMSERSLCN